MHYSSLIKTLYQLHFLSSWVLGRETNRFYLMFLLRNFATGLIAIFEPIYFFNYFQKNISAVLLYYAFLFGIVGSLTYWTVKITGKIGLKHSIILSFPVNLVYYLLLWNIERHAIFLPLTLITAALAVLLFWMPVNIYFGAITIGSKIGRHISAFNILMGLSFALGPLLGGFIISKFDWSALFLTVMALLIATSVTLFFSPEMYERYTVSFRAVMREVVQKDYLPKTFAFAANGGEFIIKGVIWPLFLFVLGITFESIGLIAAVAFLAGTLFTIYIGTLTDRLSKTKLLATGSMLLSLTWILKLSVKTTLTAFLANVVYGLTNAMTMVPFMAIFYKDFDASRSHIIVLREITLNAGRALTLLFFAVVFLFTDKLYLSFLAAALLVPFFNLLALPRRS